MSLIVSDLPWPAQQQGAPIAADYLSGLRLVIDGGAQYPQALSFSQTDADGFRVLGTARVGGSGRGWSGAASTYVSARTTTTNPSPLFEIPANSDWTAQFVIDGVSGISGTNHGFFRGGETFVGTTFIVQDGSNRRPWMRVNGTDVLRPASGPQWTTGQTLNLIARFRNASRADFWWDGRLQHSATHSASQNVLFGTAGIYALLMQNSTEITGGNLAAFRFWTRYLDDAQTQALAQSPQALYEPLRIWVPVAAGAAGGTGSLAATLADATSAATGTLLIQGATSATLAAATSTATGALAIKGTTSATLAAATSTATGALAINGTTTATLDAATLAATGELQAAGSGTLAATLAAATVAATGTLRIAGTTTATLAAATSTATGTLRIQGTLTGTLDAATLEADGTGAQVTTGTLSATLADATVSSAATLRIQGATTATLADASVVATGRVDIAATLGVTLADAILVATGGSLSPISGTLAATLADATLSASSVIRTPSSDVAYALKGRTQTYPLTGRSQTATVTDPQTYPLAGRTQP